MPTGRSNISNCLCYGKMNVILKLTSVLPQSPVAGFTQ